MTKDRIIYTDKPGPNQLVANADNEFRRMYMFYTSAYRHTLMDDYMKFFNVTETAFKQRLTGATYTVPMELAWMRVYNPLTRNVPTLTELRSAIDGASPALTGYY